MKHYKINREDPSETVYSNSYSIVRDTASGLKTETRNDFEDIMKHSYLRKSMEQRIERKALFEEFKSNKQKV